MKAYGLLAGQVRGGAGVVVIPDTDAERDGRQFTQKNKLKKFIIRDLLLNCFVKIFSYYILGVSSVTMF